MKYRKAFWIAPIVIALLHSSTRITLAGECPSSVIGRTGELFVSPAECTSPGCLLSVDSSGDYAALRTASGQETSLISGRTYTFFAKTKKSNVENSVVAVQIKGIFNDASSGPRSSRIKLSRDQTEFACSAGHKLPLEDTEVGYKAYDRYHRTGYTYSDDGKIIHERFHIRYKRRDGDGEDSCVATNDRHRRHLLLMQDRGNYADSWAKEVLAQTFGKLVSPVYAGEEDYNHFRVKLTNYKKFAGRSTCYSFPVTLSTGGSRPKPLIELNVVLRDLEELQGQPAVVRNAPVEWRFKVQEAQR